MKEIPILDQNNVTNELFKREMKAYFVKSEAEYQALAFKRYTQELDSRNSQNGSQEKNYSGGRTKEATLSSGRGRGRGSKGSRGSNNKKTGFNSSEDFSPSCGGQKNHASADSELIQNK